MQQGLGHVITEELAPPHRMIDGEADIGEGIVVRRERSGENLFQSRRRGHDHERVVQHILVIVPTQHLVLPRRREQRDGEQPQHRRGDDDASGNTPGLAGCSIVWQCC